MKNISRGMAPSGGDRRTDKDRVAPFNLDQDFTVLRRLSKIRNSKRVLPYVQKQRTKSTSLTLITSVHLRRRTTQRPCVLREWSSLSLARIKRNP